MNVKSATSVSILRFADIRISSCWNAKEDRFAADYSLKYKLKYNWFLLLRLWNLLQ